MTLQMVKVLDLIKYLDESVDVPTYQYEDRAQWWAAVVAEKNDFNLPILVDNIIREGFTTPICVVVDEGEAIQGDGHHRLVASILLMLDEIPVWFTDDRTEYLPSESTGGGQLFGDIPYEDWESYEGLEIDLGLDSISPAW
jgi:hypothetical protein